MNAATRLERAAHGVLAIAVLLCLPWSPHASAADRYEGIAYAKADGELLYRELHLRYEEKGASGRVVLYRCPDGTPFARKRLRVASDASAPEFEFVDGRDGYREGVRGEGDRREVFVQAGREEETQRRMVRIGPDGVVDAGFDALIRRHWDDLLAGNSVTAAFLLPSRFDFLGVSISRVASAEGDDSLLRLRMKLDAWYGFAVPQTDLAYRASDRWLLRFEGIGSIRDGRGRNQAVRIEFPPELYAASVDRAEVDTALARPLDGRCNG